MFIKVGFFCFVFFLQVAGEQKYHPECFSCLNCRAFIGDGDTYALVERSKLYWWASVYALLKKFTHWIALDCTTQSFLNNFLANARWCRMCTVILTFTSFGTFPPCCPLSPANPLEIPLKPRSQKCENTPKAPADWQKLIRLILHFKGLHVNVLAKCSDHRKFKAHIFEFTVSKKMSYFIFTYFSEIFSICLRFVGAIYRDWIIRKAVNWEKSIYINIETALLLDLFILFFDNAHQSISQSLSMCCCSKSQMLTFPLK